MPGVSCVVLPEPIREVLRSQADCVRRLHASIKEADKRCKAVTLKTEFGIRGGELVSGSVLLPVLVTHPGIGELTAIIWLSEVSDAGRFKNKNAAAAYAGVDPTLKVSAGKVSRHVRRMGNKKLNAALIMAAKGLINRRGEELGKWGYMMSRSKKHGGYKKAAGSVARRMVWSLWAMHRDVQPYSVERFNYWRVKEVPEVPVREMELGRYAAVLEALGLRTSKDVAAAYQADLATRKGVGPKCLEAVRLWIESHKQSKHAQGQDYFCVEKSCVVPERDSVIPRAKS